MASTPTTRRQHVGVAVWSLTYRFNRPGRVVAEKGLSEELSGAPAHWLISTQALIKWVLKRRISKDHFDRVWRELNVDEIGGIGFADFSSFFDDPAFQTPLPEAQIDLRGVATKKKKRSFFHRKKSTKKVD